MTGAIRRLPLLLCLALILPGCPKRDTGEINVDEIQKTVDSVEDHLRAMRVALKSKKLGEAEDHYKEAAEIMEENQAQLAAYPEVGLLSDRVNEAEGDLCYGFANITLSDFFDAVRGKDVGGARSKLKVAQREFERCKSRIEGRDDFVALKMNIESAPQSLKDLEKELLRDKWLEEIARIQKESGSRIQDIRSKLSQLEKQPNQRELALQIDRDIKAVRESIGGEKEFAEDPEWIAVASKITGELQEMDDRRVSMVRRGKILWMVSDVLPKAAKSSTMAVATRDRAQALKMVEEAAGAYRQCEELLEEGLKAEKELGKFSFMWRGARRNAAWLRTHCRANRQITERMAARLSGKPLPKQPEKPKAAAPKEPPKQEEKKPEETKKPAKKPVKKKRKSRIRRW